MEKNQSDNTSINFIDDCSELSDIDQNDITESNIKLLWDELLNYLSTEPPILKNINLTKGYIDFKKLIQSDNNNRF
jgi:inhibitor of KinA sporulation pathway (predicted exonuclease)